MLTYVKGGFDIKQQLIYCSYLYLGCNHGFLKQNLKYLKQWTFPCSATIFVQSVDGFICVIVLLHLIYLMNGL